MTRRSASAAGRWPRGVSTTGKRRRRRREGGAAEESAREGAPAPASRPPRPATARAASGNPARYGRDRARHGGTRAGPRFASRATGRDGAAGIVGGAGRRGGGTRRHERPHPRRPIRDPRHDDPLGRGRRLRQVAVAARAADSGPTKSTPASSCRGAWTGNPNRSATRYAPQPRESASASQRRSVGGTGGVDEGSGGRTAAMARHGPAAVAVGPGHRRPGLSAPEPSVAPPGRRGSRGPDPPRSRGTPTPAHASSRPRTATPSGPA